MRIDGILQRETREAEILKKEPAESVEERDFLLYSEKRIVIEYNRRHENLCWMCKASTQLWTVGESGKGETVASRRHKPSDRRESHLGEGKSHSTGVESI